MAPPVQPGRLLRRRLGLGALGLAAAWCLAAPRPAPAAAPTPEQTFIQGQDFAARLAAWRRLVRAGGRIPAILNLVKRAEVDPRVLPRLKGPDQGRLLAAVLAPPADPGTPVRFRPAQVEALLKVFPQLRLLDSDKKGHFVVLYHGVVLIVLAESYLRYGLPDEAARCLTAAADYALDLEARATADLYQTQSREMTQYRYYKLTETGRIRAALGRRLRRLVVAFLARLLLGSSPVAVRTMAAETLATLSSRLPLPSDIFSQALSRETMPALKATLKRLDRELRRKNRPSPY
jgi:hypothetical protein